MATADMRALKIEEFKGTQCYQELKLICDTFEASSEDSKNVKAKDKIIATAKAHDYAKVVHMNCKEVGGAPFNRGGEGLLWSRSHSRVKVIQKSGFSMPAIAENLVSVQEKYPFNEYSQGSKAH